MHKQKGPTNHYRYLQFHDNFGHRFVWRRIPTTALNLRREHALLVRSLGVSQLVVAVNKLDTVDWSQQRFNHIQDKLKVFLTKQVPYRYQKMKNSCRYFVHTYLL